MMLFTSMPRIEEHRVPVVFDCPHCRAENVRGTAYDLRETIRLSQRVPLWGWESHWVRCSNCQTELYADQPSKAFAQVSAATVNQHIHAYLPLTKRFLAVTSLLIGWTPVVGVVLALLATFVNLNTRGWPRWMSITGLILAVVINLAAFVALAQMMAEYGTASRAG
ncbi:MAG TPA: hypothetical protein VGB55_12145 [Tepidisphaeraceae bacterium]|jgi:hypothetical protein